ncbi:MAG: ATP-binding protein [Deltaproteobacteria bacterium]|nr:ATP-binding protein [Deltaproteobacteria bacterium]
MEQDEERLMELIERIEEFEDEGLLIGGEDVLKKILERSEVILITGRRGAGKTALGYYILEQSPNPYVFGLPEEAWQYLPESITPLKSLENLPEKATIFIDEAALWFYSRSSSQKLNKYISQLVTEARHQEQLLIFATHTLRKLDIGVVMDADAIFFKEPSFLHSKFERSEIREITREVMRHFSRLKDDHCKYTYVLSHDYEGFIKTPLPSFWCEELSKVSVSVSSSDSLTVRSSEATHSCNSWLRCDFCNWPMTEYITVKGRKICERCVDFFKREEGDNWLRALEEALK